MKSFTPFFIFDSQKVATVCAVIGKAVKRLHSISCDFLRGKNNSQVINYYENIYDVKNGKKVLKVEYFTRQSGAYVVLIGYEDMVFTANADWALLQTCECEGKGLGYDMMKDTFFCPHFNKQAPFIEFGLSGAPKSYKIWKR